MIGYLLSVVNVQAYQFKFRFIIRSLLWGTGLGE
jgi:hypothetical protein